MAEITAEQVLDALRAVKDPDLGEDIVSLGMVDSLQIKDNQITFSIEVDPERGPLLEGMRQEAEAAVHSIDGVDSVTAVLTAERPARSEAPPPPQQPQMAPKMMLPGIDAVVVVASGKGGVGKSTTTVNLALAMAAGGKRIGILDADIYGPSIPRMLGVTDKPAQTPSGKIEVLEGHGVKCMSIGFLVEEDSAVIWRGPMATGALEQLLTDVAWGELDALVIDMPPGTGDIHLTMAQRVPVNGAIIVSTPQDIALADARRGIAMFKKMDIPVFGMIENMAYFLCPDNNIKYYIFGQDGAKNEAIKQGIDVLGEIPLDTQIRENSDAGTPIITTQPDGDHARTYNAIAAKVWEKIGGG